MNLRRFVPILALLAMGTATMEASSAESDPFAKGRMGVSVYLGGGTAGSESYYTFGAGLSYYLVNGLWLGVSGETPMWGLSTAVSGWRTIRISTPTAPVLA